MNEQGLYDIYGTWHVPFWQTKLFTSAAIVFITLFLIGISYFLLKKYYFIAKHLSAEQEALKSLSELKNKKISNQKQGQALYFEVTEILKIYIHKSLGYDVMGLTDEELIDFLQQNYFPTHALQHIKDICHGCVYIKFAQDNVLQEQIATDLEKSAAIVHKVQEHLQLREK